MNRTTLFVGALLSFLLCVAAVNVTAQRSLECQMVWSEASSSNDLVDCLKDSKRIGSQWRYYLYPGFAALIFVFTLVGLPIVFCCRCCSCCRCCVEPKETTDRGVAQCWLWMWIVIAVLAACGVCVLLVYGVVLLTQSVDKVLHNAQYVTVAYFNETKTNITELLTDYSKNPPTQPAVDLSAFNTVMAEVGDNVAKIRNDYFKYFRIAEIVVCCVGGVGAVLMLCMLIFACCRCTGCCPVAWSCLYFFFAIIFALLAVLFTVCIYAMYAACGEVTLHYKREPGVFQWYLVPWCDSEFDFTSLRSQVSDLETSAAQSACDELLKYCDNTDVYPGTDEKKIFMCGKGLTTSSNCKTLDDVVEVIQATYAKTILTNTLCVNQTGLKYLEKCTVAECAERCVDYKHPDIAAKTYATQIIEAASYAANISTALTYVHPLLECNFIIDKVANTIETPKYGSSFTTDSEDVQYCSAARSASVMLGTGFFVGALMFILGIYVMHRGSWVWGEMREAEEEEARGEDKKAIVSPKRQPSYK
jgi:flagellar basal body-associated protein FliL